MNVLLVLTVVYPDLYLNFYCVGTLVPFFPHTCPSFTQFKILYTYIYNYLSFLLSKFFIVVDNSRT